MGAEYQTYSWEINVKKKKLQIRYNMTFDLTRNRMLGLHSNFKPGQAYTP